MVTPPMAIRTEGNRILNDVRASLCQRLDVMHLEERKAIVIPKRRLGPAKFTMTYGPNGIVLRLRGLLK